MIGRPLTWMNCFGWPAATRLPIPPLRSIRLNIVEVSQAELRLDALQHERQCSPTVVVGRRHARRLRWARAQVNDECRHDEHMSSGWYRMLHRVAVRANRARTHGVIQPSVRSGQPPNPAYHPISHLEADVLVTEGSDSARTPGLARTGDTLSHLGPLTWLASTGHAHRVRRTHRGEAT